MKKNAFTLVEILIAVGVIGIVASMTIPTMITNLRGKKLQSQFNKTYSDLNQAARAFYEDNDMTVREYQDSIYAANPMYTTATLKKFMSYFKGYYDSNYAIKNYYPVHGLRNLNLNGEEISTYPCDRSNAILDLAGRIYSSDDAIPPESAKNFKICVDINGNNKPNKWGVDKFVFAITEKNSVEPFTGSSWANPAIQQTNETTIQQYCSTTQSTPVVTCAYFALKNISPDGNGDYWHDFLRGKY